MTPAASITRNLLRAADFMPALYGFAIISMLVRRDFKRLGDIAANTLVVYRAPAAPKITVSELEPLAPVVPLKPADQAAVVALAARASRLTPERLDELAALAAWVSGDAGRSGPEVTRRVLAVAQWLLGKRMTSERPGSRCMTPLQFEAHYQHEWDELQSLLAHLRWRAQAPRADCRRALCELVSTRMRATRAGACAFLSRVHRRAT